MAVPRRAMYTPGNAVTAAEPCAPKLVSCAPLANSRTTHK